MTTTNHPPGPWMTTLEARPVEGGEDDELEICIRGANPNQRVIASTFKTNGFHIDGMVVVGCGLDEATANARLIAAAPELLHSLEQTVASLTYWFGRYDDPEGAMSLMMKQARAAIAKAKGE